MSDKLTAEQYREALILTLAELEDLDPRQVLETHQRLSRLKLHIATVAGTVEDGMAPTYGLRALRHMGEEVTPNEQR